MSALDDDDAFDFNLTASWLHEQKSAFIKREGLDAMHNPTLLKDLQYAQTRDVLNLRMDFGILWDVGIHVEAPLVLADNRSLSFDQSAGSGCIFTGDKPTCVDQGNSQVLKTGILPGYNQSTYGLNSRTGQPFNQGTTVFQGPTRSGFENLGLGIQWAAFNQRRDDTRPTWLLGFDAKLDVFKDMRFDSSNPNANTAVGPGYHQFIWSTTVSKRFRYFDPYFGAWYMLPVRTNGSIYQVYPSGNQTAINPQQQAGVQMGVEQIAWENPRANQRVTVEFRARATEHFYGRSASELWEALAGSSQCTSPASTACRPGIDYNPGDTNAFAYPGVTETQEYASFGGDVGLNVQVGKYVRFRGLFGLLVDEPHYITYTGAGIDRTGDGRVDSGNPNERNILYRDAIDAPGQRFRVEGTQIWSLLLEGSIMF
ncbi:MAG TPA: hypothetical protein VH560_09815 [Polyangia bacterium]|nr:hypothetical protein [Polyangia bacterium]